MRLFNALIDKLYIKQWNIGLVRANIKDIIEKGQGDLKYHWLPAEKDTRFFADPFIFKNPDGNINVIYEDYTYSDQYGKISMTMVDKDFKPLMSRELLDTQSHLSYPNVFHENGKTYIIPEASKGGHLYSYEYDFENHRLINRKMIMENVPLLDSTILRHEGKYWLFATHRGANSNNKLFIYYSNNWDGPYTPHQANPVKNTLNGSRPAGNFILSGGEIYRPTQNCGDYYGKSITLNKITRLDEEGFAEEPKIDLCPPKNTNFNYAIHTINFSDDVIVIDGLRRLFKPMEQIRIFFRKKMKMTKLVYPLVNLYTTNEYFIPQISMMMEC